MVVSETGRVNGSEQSPPATHPAARSACASWPCKPDTMPHSLRHPVRPADGRHPPGRRGCKARVRHRSLMAQPEQTIADKVQAPVSVGTHYGAKGARTPGRREAATSPRHMPGAFSCPAPSARGWARRAPPGRRDRDRPSLTAELVALRCRAGILLPRGDIHGAETQPARPRRHAPLGL